MKQLYKTCVIHFQSEGENPHPHVPELWHRNGHLRFSQTYVRQHRDWSVAFVVIPELRRSYRELSKALTSYEVQLIQALSKRYQIHNSSFYGERRIGHFLLPKKSEGTDMWAKRIFPQVMHLLDLRIENLNGATQDMIRSAANIGQKLVQYPLFIGAEKTSMLQEKIQELNIRIQKETEAASQ